MNRATVSLIMIALLLPAPALLAQEKIVGAFGMRLGDEFVPSSAIGRSALTDGTIMYQFNPNVKFRSFDKYYVMITPITHKIYSIWGTGIVENNGVGQKEQAVIMALLEKKYGKKEEAGFLDTLTDATRVDQGDRYILVKVSGFSDVTIDIRYYDKKLSELAEKERVEGEAKKAGSGGL